MRRLIALLAAVLLLGTAAACSSDDSTTATQDEAQSQDDGGNGDGGETPDISDDIDVPPGFGNLEACTELSLAYMTLSFGGLGALGGEEAMAEMDEAFGDLEGAIPEELQGDFEVLEEAYQEFGSSMEGGANFTDPEAMEEAAAALETPEVEEAQGNIETWLEENCSEGDFGPMEGFGS